MDPIDFHTREQILKTHENDRFWNTFKISLEELIIEKQKQVNDLETEDKDLFKYRVELNLLQDFSNGNLIKDFINILEDLKKDQEEKAEESREITANKTFNG